MTHPQPQINNARWGNTSKLRQLALEEQSLDDTCAFCETSGVLYAFDLPTEEECMLAETCYVTQLQWHVIPIDEESMALIRANRRKGCLTTLQLAYLYTLLAVTGRLAPSTHRAASTLSLSWSNKRTKYIEHACLLLDHLDVCQAAKETLTTTSQLLKIQIGLLIARYLLLQKAKDREAYKRLRDCLNDAEQKGYFDEPIAPVSLQEDYVRAELYNNDKWYMLVKGRPARSGPTSEVSTRWRMFPDSGLDSLKHKVETFFLAAKVGTVMLSSDKMEDWSSKAEKADLEIIECIAGYKKLIPTSKVLLMPSSHGADTSTELANFKEQYVCTSTIMFFRSMRLHLLGQMQAVMQDNNKPQAEVISIMRLQIANDMLRQMPEVKSLLYTTWNSLAQSYQPWLVFDIAMSTFANAIEQTGYVSLTNSLTPSTPPQVVIFVASFGHIFDVLNDFGYLGPSALRCAQMIKVVPIPAHCAISDSSFEEAEPAIICDDGASSTGSNATTTPTLPPEAPPACDLCRERKVKCDRQKPVCAFCADRGACCTYNHQHRKRGPVTKAERQQLTEAGFHYDRKQRRWRKLDEQGGATVLTWQ